MADPLSVASGVVALTTFAIQSSQTLAGVISSYRNRTRNVRELNEELEDLTTVLAELDGTLKDPEIDLSALELPLLRCGEACGNLTKLIEKCTSRTKKDTTTFKEWFLLSYRGNDISSFRNLMAAYKSTISIALAGVNIRYVRITHDLLLDYKERLGNTTTDLQEILQGVDHGSQYSTSPRDWSIRTDLSDLGDFDQAAVEEERASIQQCLDVCMQVSKYIDQAQQENLIVNNGPITTTPVIIAGGRPSQVRMMTSEKLEDCKTGIGFTVAELQLRLKDANHRLTKLLNQPRTEGNTNGVNIQTQAATEELESIKQCLSICEGASAEMKKEGISVFDGAKQIDDGQQVIVSTFGALISAKNVTTGARSLQLLGHMSDETIQKLSVNWASASERFQRTAVSTINDPVPTSSGQLDSEYDPSQPQFLHRHGSGRKLG